MSTLAVLRLWQELYTCAPAHLYTCTPVHLYTCAGQYLATLPAVVHPGGQLLPGLPRPAQLPVAHRALADVRVRNPVVLHQSVLQAALLVLDILPTGRALSLMMLIGNSSAVARLGYKCKVGIENLQLPGHCADHRLSHPADLHLP